MCQINFGILLLTKDIRQTPERNIVMNTLRTSRETIIELQRQSFVSAYIEVVAFASGDVITGSNDGEWDED